jgi:aryl-alcohol dehydrogenase-like predicted oxidoreductase
VVVATKVLGPMGEGPNDKGLSRYHIMNQAEASLERLQTDHIDLYQIHGWDPATPMEETLRAFEDLVSSGMVRYIGVSNWAAWQIAKALGIAATNGYSRFETVQAYYTIAGRDLEREIVPMMQSEGLGLLVWSPLAGGLLSGKYSREDEASTDGRRASFDFPPVDRDRAYDAIDVMREIAGAHDATIPQIAIAWLLKQDVTTSVIIGAKRKDQLDDNLGACGVALTDADMEKLDAVSQLPKEYPGWMFERQGSYRDPNA